VIRAIEPAPLRDDLVHQHGGGSLQIDKIDKIDIEVELYLERAGQVV
jgi:hypothetical protein